MLHRKYTDIYNKEIYLGIDNSPANWQSIVDSILYGALKPILVSTKQGRYVFNEAVLRSFISHSYRRVHIFTFPNFRLVALLSTFLSFFLSVYLYFLLYKISQWTAGLQTFRFMSEIIFFCEIIESWIFQDFYKQKTEANNICYFIFPLFPCSVKHIPFSQTPVPCSFILYTSDNRSFDKANFHLMYISLQKFLLLNFTL